jgi:hypothetical protein
MAYEENRHEHVERSTASKWISVGLLFLVLAMIAIGIFSGDPSAAASVPQERFDERVWRASGGVHSMCADLQANHLHKGMSREQVIDLLGPPEDEGPGVISWDVGGPIGEHFNVVLDSGQRVERVFLEGY